MRYNYNFCTNQNIWKLTIDDNVFPSIRRYVRTTCLYNFTKLYKEAPRKIITGTLYLRYYTEKGSGNSTNVSNYLLCTEEEQIRYLNLCKEIVSFEYKIDHKKTYYWSNTKCLIINFKNCNYVTFMLILTLVRYTYEFPASKFISDVLKFYDYLNGKENIINCIHCVFKAFNVTHSHQTQTIFPYLNAAMPYFINKESLQSLCIYKKTLFDLFPSWYTTYCSSLYYYRTWDSEQFEQDFYSKRLYNYLNIYNICKLKSM